MKKYKSLADYEKDRLGYVENPAPEQPKKEQKEQKKAGVYLHEV